MEISKAVDGRRTRRHGGTQTTWTYAPAPRELAPRDQPLAVVLGLAAPTRTKISGPDGGPVKLDVDPADEILGKLASLAADLGAGAVRPEPEPG
jgi:hypothetical protein